ncbi:response regulator transcription factor [Flavobacterium sp. HSC-61S13]|uniref:response regulator transcription factor n=1 Tax=Flavobacterium sp. HSC-61S13 TaxID=2910963 RepID=UPI00209FF528|nr:response regulator transcription factor [Flavobacterium sp. HSC-61S13]MCP1994348.1 DNA-binding NarL/FixJ family response regulator [Flavobacterium sp. HSC-61S13]
MEIKVGIIDDHKLFRKSFALLLSQLEGIEVVFQCSNAIELLELLKRTKIDVLFLDIQMPVMDGFEVAHKLNVKYPNLNILVLSSFNDSYSIERMLQYNISGYLTKNSTVSQLKKAIICVHNKGIYYDTQISEIITDLEGHKRRKDVKLTDIEVEIIKLFAKQHSGREIAKILSISMRTVEKHKEILMQKTQARNFIGVINFAILRHYLNDDDLKQQDISSTILKRNV